MRLARTLLIVAVILLAIGLLVVTTPPLCQSIPYEPGIGVTHAPPIYRCIDTTSGMALAPLAGGAALLVLGLWRAWVSR